MAHFPKVPSKLGALYVLPLICKTKLHTYKKSIGKIKNFYNTSISKILDSGEETEYSVWTATKQIYVRKIWRHRGGDY